MQIYLASQGTKAANKFFIVELFKNLQIHDDKYI